MSDLMRYVRERAKRDAGLVERLETSYPDFEVGALLRLAREDAGLTQAQLAERLGTKKSAISRIENHAGDIRLSTLRRYARAVGLAISVELKPYTPLFQIDPDTDEEAPPVAEAAVKRRRRAGV